MARNTLSRFVKLLVGGATGISFAVLSSTKTNTDQSFMRSFSQNIQHVIAASPILKEAYKGVITPWNSNWDNRESGLTLPNASMSTSSDGDAQCAVRKPKFTRHILLVRHGQYHYANDDANCHLTALGHEQTDLTGQRLKQLNLPYSRIVYSTMTRAVESAEEIIKYLPGVPTMPCDFLREGAPFPPEPPVPNWPQSENAYLSDGPRIESAFSHYIHRADPDQISDTYEILICHANVIRYFACRSLQVPPEAWIRMSLDNGSLTWITVRPSGNVSLRWLGNSGYMPPDKISVQ